jgi:hypothetical protein
MTKVALIEEKYGWLVALCSTSKLDRFNGEANHNYPLERIILASLMIFDVLKRSNAVIKNIFWRYFFQ